MYIYKLYRKLNDTLTKEFLRLGLHEILKLSCLDIVLSCLEIRKTKSKFLN